MRVSHFYIIFSEDQIISGISVSGLSDRSMFVTWSGPSTINYIVNAWTPNGLNTSVTTKNVNVAPFLNLTSTKPYYVSIRPAPTVQGNPAKCPPKEVMGGMFYVYAKGRCTLRAEVIFRSINQTPN